MVIAPTFALAAGNQYVALESNVIIFTVAAILGKIGFHQWSQGGVDRAEAEAKGRANRRLPNAHRDDRELGELFRAPADNSQLDIGGKLMTPNIKPSPFKKHDP